MIFSKTFNKAIFSLIGLALMAGLTACANSPSGTSSSKTSSGNLTSSSSTGTVLNGVPVDLKLKCVGTSNLKLKSLLFRDSPAPSGQTITNGNGCGLTNGNVFAFTPSSMKCSIDSISLYETVTTDSQGNAVTAGKQITVTNSTFTVDIAGGSDSTLMTFSFTVPPENFGSYHVVNFQFHGPIPYSVSGNVVANGITYNFTDIPVTMNNAGRMFVRSSPIIIDSNSSPTIQVYFDTGDGVYLTYNSQVANSGPDCCQLTNTNGLALSNTYIAIGKNETFLMYAGNGQPTVNRYLVQLAAGDNSWGDPTSFGIKMTVIQDTDGSLAGVNWQEMFFSNYNDDNSHFAIAPLYAPYCISNIDGSWQIMENPSVPTGITGIDLSFPAFQLGNHTGVLHLPSNTNHNYICTNMD